MYGALGIPEESKEFKVQIGRVAAFFAQPMMANINLTAPLKVGDRLHIRGLTTNVELVVKSIQLNNAEVKEAKSGDIAEIKVPERVRKGDLVYRVG